jgi:hypothetical protein
VLVKQNLKDWKIIDIVLFNVEIVFINCRGTICVKIIQIQEVPVPSLLKENPLLCHEADAALDIHRSKTEINIAIYKPLLLHR